MKYLCTGGAGFIGSHLVEHLLREFDAHVTVLDGHSDKVIVVDDFSMGKYANLPRDPRLEVYDISIMGDIDHFFKDIDIVFHLAALTRPQWSIQYPADTNEINVTGTLKVLEHCRDNKVKKVVFISSSSIYGEQEKYPSKEDDLPNPMSPYALSKYIGEEYCVLFEKLYGLKCVRIRPFNPFGIRMNPKGAWAGAVPTFVDLIKKGLTPTIVGDGEQKRDYVYIDDVVDLIMLAAHSDISCEVFNAGSGTCISINDLFNRICKIMGQKVEPTHAPKMYEPLVTLADMNKATKLLGWKQKISLDEGLRMAVEGMMKD